MTHIRIANSPVVLKRETTETVLGKGKLISIEHLPFWQCITIDNHFKKFMLSFDCMLNACIIKYLTKINWSIYNAPYACQSLS